MELGPGAGREHSRRRSWGAGEGGVPKGEKETPNAHLKSMLHQGCLGVRGKDPGAQLPWASPCHWDSSCEWGTNTHREVLLCGLKVSGSKRLEGLGDASYYCYGYCVSFL